MKPNILKKFLSPWDFSEERCFRSDRISSDNGPYSNISCSGSNQLTMFHAKYLCSKYSTLLKSFHFEFDVPILIFHLVIFWTLLHPSFLGVQSLHQNARENIITFLFWLFLAKRYCSHMQLVFRFIQDRLELSRKSFEYISCETVPAHVSGCSIKEL